jgi:RNA polymerase sigma-70 factor (ECF subfamily)
VLTDGEVIQLVGANRRDEALAEILRGYRRKVFGLAYSFVRNRETAEDVAQEVFIKVWRALPAFDARASLSTWIYAITRNTSLSALRVRRNQAQLDDDVAIGAELEIESAAAEASAENALLLRLVQQLPEKQRQVVLLFYMQEQSHEEVAKMLAMPVGTVKTLLHRARMSLAAAAGASGT